MRPRLVAVGHAPSTFAPLIAVLAAEGLRCGWLELADEVAPPRKLEAAACLGVLRAVSAVGDRAIAVKPVRGAFVLDDLLREHFAGCDLVLVHGEVEAPRLTPGADGHWVVAAGDGGAERRVSSEQLARRLRRRDWWPRASG